ncbi:GntR family transcriptional regulator [Nitratireductor aquimarinus]|uniref:GntR family transcriptional regulator n=1 Tax=Nitratireductor TaxID=245876 RepID=UPI0019D37E23|nr:MULTISPECIES: GntR family transcriptional regulator [Nitratireductor]MBN7776256.1 GntR family transcriptional regulator [Nitratireductor pacificus]MBN7779123.1 GntR family transcriptional regulator [Nitratireductor pacificus]MBN7787930.1 GntR family transcriptional regulator [Nitratireductor aquimarinus]MBY6097977.1 GntR family transcriptional regulator [Nitratireductor aquimarinus]MCA1259835.1 GntR family transcriptional regulator [Nitratireductor aquimarinus]
MTSKGEKATSRRKRPGTMVGLIHDHLRSLIIEFQLRPGDRINEVELTERLKVSRTPLREAINRLLAEQLVEFRPNQGFYIRRVDVNEIVNLFEVRTILETSMMRLVVERASDEELQSLSAFWEDVMGRYYKTGSEALVHSDAIFHERLAEIAKNPSLLSFLQDINSRIHFVRWANLYGEHRKSTFSEHETILKALMERDAEKAASLMEEHISHRSGGLQRAIADGLLHGMSKPTGPIPPINLENPGETIK